MSVRWFRVGEKQYQSAPFETLEPGMALNESHIRVIRVIRVYWSLFAAGRVPIPIRLFRVVKVIAIVSA